MHELWLYSPHESAERYSNLLTVWRKNDSALISKRKAKCSETIVSRRGGRQIWQNMYVAHVMERKNRMAKIVQCAKAPDGYID